MSLRVLVVDDTKFMRAMLKDILVQFGYEVIGEAENGKQGVQMYDSLRPDIVLMDISMPEKDGISALKDMLAIDPDAVILICSGMSQQDLISEAMKAGAKGYVMKPFKQNKILEVITRYAMPFIEQKKLPADEPPIGDEPAPNAADAAVADAGAIAQTDEADAIMVAESPMISALLDTEPDTSNDELPELATEAADLPPIEDAATLQPDWTETLTEETMGETLAEETLVEESLVGETAMEETLAEETLVEETLTAAEAEEQAEEQAEEMIVPAKEQAEEITAQTEIANAEEAVAATGTLEELFARTMRQLVEKNRKILEKGTSIPPSGAKVINLFRSDAGVKDFISSYTCRWKEEVDGNAIGYLVTYTEGDNKISIETVGGNNNEEGMPLTYDSLKNLLTWLEPKLAITNNHGKELGKKAEM
ncbi:MAG TPA: response regulator [Bacilli bacterium]